MCGIDQSTIDRLIAARHAEYRKVSMSPFGPEDELGMLNLITPQYMGQILAEADGSKPFDLSVQYFIGMPSWTAAGDPSFQIWMSHTPNGNVNEDRMGVGRTHNELVSYSGDCIMMYTHCGTHLDTVNHFGYHGQIWNGFSEKDHLGSRHWNKCGAENVPPIITRGILIDVPTALGMDMLPDRYGIGQDDLRQALDRQGTEVRPGDVVLVRTGRMKVWPDPEKYMPNQPGLIREGAEYLAKAGAVVIGSDTLSLEQVPSSEPDNWLPVHTYLFSEAGVNIIEVADLEKLAAEGVYEFAFIGACLPIRGATGSPLRPIVLPLRK